MLIPTFMDDFLRFRTSTEEITEDVVEIAKELELEVEPEDVTELLQSHDKTFSGEDLLLMKKKDEQRTEFLEMEFTPGEDAVNIVMMTAKDIEYYINIAPKAGSMLGRTDSNLKEVVLWVKCYQTEKSFMKGRVCQCSKPHCLPICLILRNCCNHPTFSNHHLDQSAAIDRKSTRLNSSHSGQSRMPSSA